MAEDSANVSGQDKLTVHNISYKMVQEIGIVELAMVWIACLHRGPGTEQVKAIHTSGPNI